MCTFSLAISIGTALLLPLSIVTNEVLLLYPDSYYIQWLNESLIHGVWNYVFLFSNISLFILLPFAYFFTESEGFSGYKKGISARVYEALVLLVLLSVLVLGIAYLLCRLLGYNDMGLINLLTLWQYLPFVYSCVSFCGVLLLLVCTPRGIAHLFTVLGDVITKPFIFNNLKANYEVAAINEMSLKRKLEQLTSKAEFAVSKSKSMPSLSSMETFMNGKSNSRHNSNSGTNQNGSYPYSRYNGVNLAQLGSDLAEAEVTRKKYEKQLRVRTQQKKRRLN